MTTSKWIFISVFVVLFAILFFGLKLTPPNFGKVETSRALNASVTDISILKSEATKLLDPSKAAQLSALESNANEIIDSEEKIIALKELSSAWYKSGNSHIAAHFAEKIADLQQDEEAWSIAGTSYLLGMTNQNDVKIRDYCKEGAFRTLENAISLNPENIDNRINYALVSVENPDKNNPMKGIMQLLDLNKKYPEDIKVLNQLGRLAIKTNQLEKARIRFESVLSLQPENKFATCQMAKVLELLGDVAGFNSYMEKCNLLD